jgi:hypothetical protein
MANQMLASTVTRVLTDQWSSTLKFSMDSLFGNLRVNGYQPVVNAIAQGQITCEVGLSQNPDRVPGHYAEARYEPETRQLRFPKEQYGLSSPSEMFNIVHEATHALFDCQYGTPAGTQILAMDDEAAAFFAQAVYSRLASPNSPSFGWDIQLIRGDPIAEALKLADKIMGGVHGVNPTYRVPEQDVDQLLISVQGFYNLHGGKAGIRHVYYGLPARPGRPLQGALD